MCWPGINQDACSSLFLKGMKAKIVRKKLLNITPEMDRELRRRCLESGRSEMAVIQDAVLLRDRFSPFVLERLDRYAEEHDLSREAACQMWLSQIADFVQRPHASARR